MNKRIIPCISSLFSLLLTQNILADGQFITSEAETVAYKNVELFLSTSIDKEDDYKNIQLPTVEIDWGAKPNLEFDISAPYVIYKPNNEGEENVWNMGEFETAIKYTLTQETRMCPIISFAPTFDWPLGKNNSSIQNTLRLPIWIDKNWNSWKASFGGGYGVKFDSNTKNYPFAGLLLQDQINDKWRLGSEIFYTGADSFEGEAFTLLNIGGSYNFTKDFNLMFSAGQTIFGEKHVIAYLGIHYVF